MRKKLYLFVLLLTALFLPADICSAHILAEEETISVQPESLSLYALSALLMDADSGRVLYEKDGYEVMAMASTTKIMTCIIALEYGNLDSEVIVSSYAASRPKVHLGMHAEETYILRDLLYSLMLESHNDSAVAIAEHVGGSVEEFAELMNQKARDLGAHNTNFVTPNGLDAEGHHTTAAELALIARYAIQNETFVEITNTPSHSFSTTSGSRSFTVNNKDAFLGQMEGAFGIKTGFTNNAGYCFVGALERDGRTFISVVLGAGWPPNKSWKWEDTRALMNYGIDHYQYQELFSPVDSFRDIFVEKGQLDTVDTYIEGSLEMLVSAWDSVDISYQYDTQLEAPVTADTTIGFAIVTVNDETVQKFPIKTKHNVLKKDYNYWFEQILNQFLL